MIKNLFILLAAMLFHLSMNAKNFSWAVHAGGTGHDAGTAIAADAAGNVYVTGVYTDSVDFDPNGTSKLYAKGQTDIFICKYNVLGNLVWAKSIGGKQRDTSHTIALDKNGDLYITGNFRDTVDFNPGAAVFEIAGVRNGAFLADIFILKLDTTGNFIWAKAIQQTPSSGGANFAASANSIAIDANNNLLISGLFDGERDFNPDAGVFAINGSDNCYVLKLSSGGSFIWAKTWNAFTYPELATDASNNVYITGSAKNNVDFDPGPNNSNTYMPSYQQYLLKLDVSGNYVWVKYYEENPNSMWAAQSYAGGIATDNNNNIWLTGYFTGDIDVNPSGASAYAYAGNIGRPGIVVKFDSAGNYIWNRPFFGGPTDEPKSLDIVTSPNGDAYLTGYFAGNYNDLVTTQLSSISNTQDAFVAKLKADGTPEWVSHSGGSSTDCGYGVAVTPTGDVYCTGSFAVSAILNIGGGVQYFATGMSDAYIMRLAACPVIDTKVNVVNPSTLSANTIATDASFQWINCNNNTPIAGAQSKDFTPLVTGSYAVIITQQGCADTSACTNVTVGINDVKRETAKIYPNPTSGGLHIEMDKKYEYLEVTITSAVGQVVKKEKFFNTMNAEIIIPGNTGLYFLNINTSVGNSITLPVTKL